MIKYTDPFGRETLVEISNQVWCKKIGFTIRKDRQTVAEAWDIETVESLIKDLWEAVKTAKENL